MYVVPNKSVRESNTRSVNSGTVAHARTGISGEGIKVGRGFTVLDTATIPFNQKSFFRTSTMLSVSFPIHFCANSFYSKETLDLDKRWYHVLSSVSISHDAVCTTVHLAAQQGTQENTVLPKKKKKRGKKRRKYKQSLYDLFRIQHDYQTTEYC